MEETEILETETTETIENEENEEFSSFVEEETELNDYTEEETEEVVVSTEQTEEVASGECETVEGSTSEEPQITLIDYTGNFEALTEQVEYLTYLSEQNLTFKSVEISFFCGLIVCFILYKFLKIFF